METPISKKEDYQYEGNKVRKVITEIIEYDVADLIAAEEAKLAEHLEQKALYLESMMEIEKEIKKQSVN